MPGKYIKVGILPAMLVLLSLVVMACGQTPTEVALSLPTASASTTAKAGPTPTAAPAASTSAAAISAVARTDVTATPFVGPTTSGAAARTPTSAARTVTATPTPRATVTPRTIKPPTGFAGKISLLGPESALYTYRFDGNQPQLVLGKVGVKPSQTVDGVLYNWPTWAADGSKLAVFGSNIKGGSVVSSDVFIVAEDGKSSYKVLDTSPDSPIFLSLSPDGNLLSLLLSSQSSALELRLVEAAQGAATPRTVAQGNVIYTGWSPDSQQLSIHAQSASANTSTNTMTVLAAKDAKAQAVPIKASPSNFRSPAFSGDGSRLAYAVLNSQSGNEEISINDKTGSAIGVLEVPGRGATFNWSPGGNKLALTYQLSGSQGLYKGIALAELDTTPAATGKLTATQIVNEPVASFFWSPDGKKLAYIGLNDEGSLITWKVYDLTTKKATALAEWIPSDAWIQLLRYFDQYAQSNSVWSPDSKALVFSGFSKSEVTALATQGPDDPIPTIYVMPVEGPDSGKFLAVAPGMMAFWAK